MEFTVPVRSPGQIQVTSVHPGSPAAQAGVRAGDLVHYGNTAIQRAQVMYATAGARVQVRVNNARDVTLTAQPVPRVNIPWAVTIIRLAFLLVAFLLAWRRPDDPATRALVAFLWCFGLAIAMNNGVLPWPVLSLIVLQIGNLALYFLGLAAAAAFAARFPSGRAHPLADRLCRIAQVLAIAAAAGVVIIAWIPHSSDAISIMNAVFLGTFVLITLLVVATLVVAYVYGPPSERQRRRWVFLILGLGLCGPIVDLIVQAAFGFQEWVDQLSLLPLGLVPFGLAYVILRHRVIDVGFVINRAIVYTGVSAVIVAIFVIVETLLGKYVEQTSHVGSVAVQLGVALVLGFSIRAIHTRVDRAVDWVLFRERHLAEALLRTFAHDAPYITELNVLLKRCVKTAERYAGVRAAGVWLANSAVYRPAQSSFAQSPEVDENDAAVLAMRARRANVDLPSPDSSLPGALALPMIVRGELLGMLVCGAKRDDETYAPDEREALSLLAASVGHAIDGIQVRELRERLQALGRRLSGLGDATDEGPAAL